MLGISISVPDTAVATTWERIKDFYLRGSSEIDVNDPNSIQGIINVRLQQKFQCFLQIIS